MQDSYYWQERYRGPFQLLQKIHRTSRCKNTNISLLLYPPPANVGNCLYLPHRDRRKTREKGNEVEITAMSAVRKHGYIFSFVPCKSLWVKRLGLKKLNWIFTYSYFCIHVRLFPRILLINKSRTPIKTKTTFFLLENAFFALTSKQTNCITGSN
jgi:hypothetical protein